MANSVISTRCPAICRLLLLAAVAARATAFAPDDDVIRFDNRSLIINGERKLLLSGGVHYARVLPAQWPRVFALVKEMGERRRRAALARRLLRPPRTPVHLTRQGRATGWCASGATANDG